MRTVFGLVRRFMVKTKNTVVPISTTLNTQASTRCNVIFFTMKRTHRMTANSASADGSRISRFPSRRVPKFPAPVSQGCSAEEKPASPEVKAPKPASAPMITA